MKDIYIALIIAIAIIVIIFAAKTFTKKPPTKEVSHYTLYYTTWCNACKAMKPIWEEVTAEITQECADDTSQTKCPDFREKDETEEPTEGIEVIPTILRHYDDGSTDRYTGGRVPEKLKAFLQGEST